MKKFMYLIESPVVFPILLAITLVLLKKLEVPFTTFEILSIIGLSFLYWIAKRFSDMFNCVFTTFTYLVYNIELVKMFTNTMIKSLSKENK